MRSRASSGTPGPRVDDAHLRAAAEAARRHPDPAGGGWWRRAFSTTLPSTRSSRPGSADDDAGTPGPGSSRPGRARSPRRRAAGTTSPRSTGRGAATSAPACSRDMSSRLPMSASSRSAESSMAASSSASSSGREGHLRRAQAADRRLDAGERGAQVVRHGREQRGAGRAVAGQRRGLAGGLLQGAALEDGAGVRREGGEQPLPVGRHLDARRARGRARRRRSTWVCSQSPDAGCPVDARPVPRRRRATSATTSAGRRPSPAARRRRAGRPNMSTACSSSTVIWSVDPSRVWVSSARAADSRWAAIARSARRALVCTTNATTRPRRRRRRPGQRVLRLGDRQGAARRRVKNQLSSSDEATAPTMAGPMPPSSATSTVSER